MDVSILILIAATLNFVLGFFVLSKGRKDILNQIFGILLLGKKLDGEVYTKDDIDNLNDFRYNCAPVLYNIMEQK